MPEFAPSELKTAIAPITVKPAGLSSEVEIFLGPNELTKVVTSGRIPFTSTGASQSVSLPIAMPATEGTYHVYIDVYAEGYPIAAYQAIKDVVIAVEEVIDFELARPTVSPETITPDTDITITCPITSACTKPQTVTAKVIIYEGSILPGHGSVIATKTSPSFSISPGQSYNVIVHHTAVAGTIDRRDIEVEIYIASLLVKQSEWDDVYYVEKPPIPEIVVDFPALSILDVEGVPFTSVGEETLYNWDAFGECLQRAFGGGVWIADGVGLARCMEAMGAVWERYRRGGAELLQCGLAHPEYITSYANSGIGKIITSYELVVEFIAKHGFDPYVGYTWETAYTTNRVTGFTSAHGEDFAIITWTQKVINWYLFSHQGACDYCAGELTPFTGLVATLAEPIEMDSLRGISLTWLNKTLSTMAGCGVFWHLGFKPAFDAPMPPPAYRNLAGRIPAQGETEAVAINSLYARGYYYLGVYDGIIQWEAGCNYFNGTWAGVMGSGRFKIKNLARVTREGAV